MKRDVEEKQEIKNYLDMLQFLNEGTDDCFFICDIAAGRVHLAGDVHKKYPLPFHGEEGNTLQECKQIVYVRDSKFFEKQLDLIYDGKTEICNMEYRVIDKKGKKEWINCRGKTRFDENGHPQWTVGRISSSILLGKVDAVTGLFNADKFMEDMHMCRKQVGTGYLLVLGIDNFKHINIKHGRSFGNHILKRVSESLEELVNPQLNVYRLDGDRFAVMLPRASQEAVEKLYADVQKKLKGYCTVSAGSAFCAPDCPEDCGMIFQYAEDALDRAKKGGKNVLVFFSPEHYQKRLETITLQEEINRGINKNCKGFYLYFQPLICRKDFHVCGCEALLRYESATHGKMNPIEFIPLLEQTELICPVGEWVLKNALKQCREWRKWLPELHINVNISYVQLREKGICEKILKILEESGLPGDALTLEITESMQLQDYQYFNKMFSQWKEAGIKIAIDDFGTGYSSLGYLKSIEIDEVKIDRCFVTNIQNSAYNYKLLANMIELAHTANIKVCCEGVETEEEMSALKELGPDMFQGYLFSRPCDKETFEGMFIKEKCDGNA